MCGLSLQFNRFRYNIEQVTWTQINQVAGSGSAAFVLCLSSALTVVGTVSFVLAVLGGFSLPWRQRDIRIAIPCGVGARRRNSRCWSGVVPSSGAGVKSLDPTFAPVVNFNGPLRICSGVRGFAVAIVGSTAMCENAVPSGSCLSSRQ